jgi:MoaA/NifB/PqqE/SkfB family radical SAM enzyme
MLAFAEPAGILHSGSDHPVSHEKIRETIASGAPVIWIGGSEPLEHPGIAHLVRAIAPSGHYIFLETNGTLLRRRIHEFQPLARLFLTVRLDAPRTKQFELAVEGIRAGRLSGFFTAAHTRVGKNADFSELERMRDCLRELDLDGWLITAEAADGAALGRAAEARKLIPNGAWRRFSRQVEHELLRQAKGREAQSLAREEKPRGETVEESVKVA